jgi:hypothetical protein
VLGRLVLNEIGLLTSVCGFLSDNSQDLTTKYF